MKTICAVNNSNTKMRRAPALTFAVIVVLHKENVEESTD